MVNDHRKYSISRRSFVKASFGTLGAISLGQTTSAFALSTNDKNVREAERIESDELIIQVYENGTFSVLMKASGTKWQPDPWEGVGCRLILENQSEKRNIIDFGSKEQIKIVKKHNAVDISFEKPSYTARVKITISLEKNIVKVKVNDVSIPTGTHLVSVEYPFRSFYLRSHDDEGYLGLAEGEGCLIPTFKTPACKKIGTTSFWTWHDDSHSVRAYRATTPLMPFYGAQKNGSGYTAIIETTDDFGFQYLMNYNLQHEFDSKGKQSPYERIVCAWPCWLGQKGRFGYQRQMRFEFSDDLDYIGMAKAYRKEAIAKGDHVSLIEKAKLRPQVDKMAGAPYLAYYAGYPHVSPGYFDYTYQQLQDVVNDLSGSMGMERAFVHFWGAYTVQPPGSLPFDTQPGSVEKLRAVSEKCIEKGFLFTLYNDISAQLEETDWWKPELMWKTEDNRVRRGMRWGRTCSSQYVDLLAKDMPEIVRTLGQEACYVDIINSGKMFECYDPVHPLTRTEDRKARLKFYQYVHSQGLIFGGEFAGWWNAAELEYTNGVGGRSKLDLFNFFPVLYQLVFHDALIPFCHAADDYSVNEGTSFEDKILRDLLRGIPPMFFINLWDHNKWRKKILDCYNVMSGTVKEVMYDEMLSHKWITDDQMVQQTVFTSGVKITVNFDEIEREGLPAKGYHVSGSKNGTKSGRFKTSWAG